MAIKDLTAFKASNGKVVNLNRVKTENLENYVDDPEERLEIIFERQQADYQAAMQRRQERQARAAAGLPDFDPEPEESTSTD